MTIWKTIHGFPAYEVSENGDVRRGINLLKPERVKGSGRKRVTLSKNGRSYRVFVSRVVAFAFIGPEPFEGAEVCHKDGFFHNNHDSNLRWGTRADNVADAVEHRLRHRKSLGRALGKHQIDAEAARFLANAGTTNQGA